VNVVYTGHAARQIGIAREWWIRNRDKAPEAFDEELASAEKFIAENPSAAQVVNARKNIRRLTLSRIRYYIYFRVRRSRIEVISLWHTSRRPPRL